MRKKYIKDKIKSQIFIIFTIKRFESAEKGIVMCTNRLIHEHGGIFMSHLLNFYEVLEIHEVVSFKITSLKKSNLFLETVKNHKDVEILEEDIELSLQEIADLKNLLLLSEN